MCARFKYNFSKLLTNCLFIKDYAFFNYLNMRTWDTRKYVNNNSIFTLLTQEAYTMIYTLYIKPQDQYRSK